jgi:hypothetical protein
MLPVHFSVRCRYFLALLDIFNRLGGRDPTLRVDVIHGGHYIVAGAIGLSVGTELIPTEAVLSRQARRIQELARRFLTAVDNGRK